LTCAKIGSLLAEEGFKVSRNIVRKLLKKNDYVKRKALKNKAAGGQDGYTILASALQFLLSKVLSWVDFK
jgi:hypothetical protein